MSVIRYLSTLFEPYYSNELNLSEQKHLDKRAMARKKRKAKRNHAKHNRK
jgi:hypothetical protein